MADKTKVLVVENNINLDSVNKLINELRTNNTLSDGRKEEIQEEIIKILSGGTTAFEGFVASLKKKAAAVLQNTDLSIVTWATGAFPKGYSVEELAPVLYNSNTEISDT